MNLQYVSAAFYGGLWAIIEDKLVAIDEVIRAHMRGEVPAFKVQERPTTQAAGGAVAVLPLWGTISHRMGMIGESSGGTSAERFTGEFRAMMSNPAVRTIILDIDSPGGEVAGVPELASEILASRGKGKRIVAVANSVAASAAYWIGSQADEFVATPSAEVGSIGVMGMHLDRSAMNEKLGIKPTIITSAPYKAEGTQVAPLTEDALANIKGRVDEMGRIFESAVAAGRGVTAAKVRSDFGKGRIVGARAAKEAGMVDRIATLDETIERYGAKARTVQRMRAEVQRRELECRV